MQLIDSVKPVPANPAKRQPSSSRLSQSRPISVSRRKAVDGFLQPSARPSRQVLPQLAPIQYRSIPQPTQRAPQPRPPAPTLPAAPQVQKTPPQTPTRQIMTQQFQQPQDAVPDDQPTRSRFKRVASILVQTILLGMLFGIGFFIRSMVIGEAFIALYGAIALIRGIASRTTFALVLMSLGVVLVASLKADLALASTFATYAFLLLVVGTVSLGREVWSEG